MKPIQHGFYRHYSQPEDVRDSFTETVYQCEDGYPPIRIGGSAKKLGSIIRRFDIPWASLEQYTGANGRVLRKIAYETELKPSRTTNEFTVTYNGMKLGPQNVKVEFH